MNFLIVKSILSVVLVVLMTVSCTNTKSDPEKGTPAFQRPPVDQSTTLSTLYSNPVTQSFIKTVVEKERFELTSDSATLNASIENVRIYGTVKSITSNEVYWSVVLDRATLLAVPLDDSMEAIEKAQVASEGLRALLENLSYDLTIYVLLENGNHLEPALTIGNETSLIGKGIQVSLTGGFVGEPEKAASLSFPGARSPILFAFYLVQNAYAAGGGAGGVTGPPPPGCTGCTTFTPSYSRPQSPDSSDIACDKSDECGDGSAPVWVTRPGTPLRKCWCVRKHDPLMPGNAASPGPDHFFCGDGTTPTTLMYGNNGGVWCPKTEGCAFFGIIPPNSIGMARRGTYSCKPKCDCKGVSGNGTDYWSKPQGGTCKMMICQAASCAGGGNGKWASLPAGGSFYGRYNVLRSACPKPACPCGDGRSATESVGTPPQCYQKACTMGRDQTPQGDPMEHYCWRTSGGTAAKPGWMYGVWGTFRHWDDLTGWQDLDSIRRVSCNAPNGCSAIVGKGEKCTPGTPGPFNGESNTCCGPDLNCLLISPTEGVCM